MIEPRVFGFLSFWIKSNYPSHQEKWSVCFRRRDLWSPLKTKKSRMWKAMLIFRSKCFFICHNWMSNPFHSIPPPPEKALELPKEWLTTDLEEQNSSKWGEKVGWLMTRAVFLDRETNLQATYWWRDAELVLEGWSIHMKRARIYDPSRSKVLVRNLECKRKKDWWEHQYLADGFCVGKAHRRCFTRFFDGRPTYTSWVLRKWWIWRQRPWFWRHRARSEPASGWRWYRTP